MAKKTNRWTKKFNLFAGVGDDTVRSNFESAKEHIGSLQVDIDASNLADGLYVEQAFRKGRRQGHLAVAQVIKFTDALAREAGGADALMAVIRKLRSLAASLEAEMEMAYKSESA